MTNHGGRTKLNYAYIEMKVSQITHIYVSANQKDKRCYKFSHKDFKYHLLRVMIGQLNKSDDLIGFVDGDWECDRNVDIEKVFQPGTYLIAVEAEWNQLNTHRVFSISTYSDKQIQLTQLNHQQPGYPLFKKMLMYYVMSPQIQSDITIKEYDNGSITKFQGVKAGLLFFIIDNHSKSVQFSERIHMKKIKHLGIYMPYKQMEDINYLVTPQTKRCILMRTKQSGDGAYSYSYTHIHSLEEIITEQDLSKKVKDNPKQVIERSFNGKGANVFVYSYETKDGYAYVFQNKSKKKYQETITLKMQNLSVVGSGSSSNIFEIILNPNQEQLLWIKSIDPYKGYSLSRSCTYQFI